MTAPEILQLVTTVVVVQIGCDLVANWRVFNQAPYKKLLGQADRAKSKLDREIAAAGKEPAQASSVSGKSGKKSSRAEKMAKRLQRAQDDYSEALANVAKKHTVPSVMTSVMFLVLLRILGTEYKGNIIGVLPFTPFKFLQRLTLRGLTFVEGADEFVGTEKVGSTSQAAAFMFIYFLCGISVKFYAGRFFGTRPPKGAESIMSVMDSPEGQKMIRKMGFDPDDLKME